jgi:hypothetical protein
MQSIKYRVLWVLTSLLKQLETRHGRNFFPRRRVLSEIGISFE